jgi:Plasmid stabilisation system protein.
MPPEARFLPRAERDLEDIAAYIAKESGDIGIAQRYVQRFYVAAERYARQPSAGSPAPHFKYGVRTFMIGK